MATEFKKGQAVNFIQNWDNKGTVKIVPAVVYSCGKKQMVLTHAETGAELGRHFRPQRAQIQHSVVIPATEDADAAALSVAEQALAYERTRYAKCLSGRHGAGYDAAIRRDMAELHEPRVIR